jgi:Family of unknown function (DUF6188)
VTTQGSNPFASVADLAILKGAELTNVSVWKYGVSLGFDDEPLTITVESGAEVQSQGRTEVFGQETIVGFGTRMLPLVGRRVSDMQASADKTIVLSFDDGTMLVLRTDDSGYESYQVNLPNGSIFVGR